jgi:aminopeptidase-like protein
MPTDIDAAQKMMDVIAELYPICRSITGNGLRESLRKLHCIVPLQIHEIPTGTSVFDWQVPREWNIREAWIKDSSGRTIVNFRDHSLHIVSYSVPVMKRLSLEALKPHLHSLPEHPDWIPYRTSYYDENWGFCLPHRLLESLGDGEYDVCIDSSLTQGCLSYGECILPGDDNQEILFSCHSCHPSLANDNLSGMVVGAYLAATLAKRQRRFTYRFLWLPGTIGAITWLALNESVTKRIRGGLVLSCVGDPGPFTYKRSRCGNAEIDRIAEHVLMKDDRNRIEDFRPIGYDERQYCSPGFNLPIGCFTRTPNGRFPEYHSSADNLSLVTSSSLGESLLQLLRVIQVFEENHPYLNLNPKCEPQLGRRGLYRQMGGVKDAAAAKEMAMLWILNLSDGRHDLLDIAERSGVPFEQISRAADALQSAGLLEATSR